MNPTNILLLAAIVLSTPACSTINTVFRDEAVAARELKKQRSHCASVPRVYSGVVYGFCTLNGEPNAQQNMAGNSLNAIPFVVVDLAASGVLDTLVLPYTIYRQNKDGSIEILR